MNVSALPHRRTAVATALILGVSLLTAPFTARAAPSPGPAEQAEQAEQPTVLTFPRPDDPDAALRDALAKARQHNRPVEATTAFTETSRTWAYPDGHLTTESYSAPTQLKQPDGTWAWLDPTLVEKDGMLRPKLAKADVAFSLGGEGPFASMTLGKGRSFSLSWPSPLPRPRIDGNVATYPGAAGRGGDLMVTALPTGFRHDVVLRERPAGPVEFRIPIRTEDAEVEITKSGELRLSTATGKRLASAPAPVMWDAAGARSAGRHASVEAAVHKNSGPTSVLVLKPDPKWLADPATRYPVTIDPTTTLGVTQEASIMSPSGRMGVAGQVGRFQACNGCGSGNPTREDRLMRALLAFDTAPITGRQVVKATMQLTLRQTFSTCTEFQGIIARRVTRPWTAASVHWGNQPVSTLEARGSVDPCSLPSTAGSVWSWNLTDMTSQWARGWPNHGVILRLASETPMPANLDETFVFWPALVGTGPKPKLSVDWVLPPEIPTVTAESIDSLDGNDAIARSTTVKVGYTSRVPESTPLDYTVTVNHSTMPAPAAQLPAGEKAHWKFDETSGATVSDSSGNNVPATLTGPYTRVPGQLGQAVGLTGGAFAATTRPVINTDQSFTVAAWIRLNSSTTEQTVFSQMGTHLPGFSLQYHTSDAPEYDQRWWWSVIHEDRPDRVYENAVQSKDLAKIGQWTHVAAQYDQAAGTIRLYVDGALAGERVHTIDWNAQGSFEIGRPHLTGKLDASVDDVHVYQRALTGEEVRALVGVPGTTTHNDIPSGQVLDKVFTLDNPASFKFVVKACRSGVTPPSCNESPAYRITSDAPTLPADTQTGMADPTQPILSGMVNRPSGGPITARYYLYDDQNLPVGASPLGGRTVNGGERASFQIPPDTVRPGSTYTWQMQACASPPLADARPLNANPFFENGAAPWTATGATLTTSTAQYHQGTAAAILTPNGTDQKAYAYSEKTIPVKAGSTYTLQGWFLQPATDELLNYWISFYDADGVYLSGSGGTQDLDQGQWTPANAAVTAPPGAARAGIQIILGNTPTPQTILYLDEVALLAPLQPSTAPDVCTPRTAATSFTTPGAPPQDPPEEVRTLALGKDSFVIKTALTDPSACNGAPCPVEDATTIRIGGTGTAKTAAVIGLRLDALPDGAAVSEIMLKLGTASCPTGVCPADAVVSATPLKNPVTAATKGSELADDVESDTTPYTLPLTAPQADIAGSENQWLLLTSNKDEVISFGEASAAEAPSLALSYLPAGPPSNVINLTASGGDGSAVATWGIPERSGGAMLFGYEVEVTAEDGAVVKTLEVTDPWAVTDGLANDHPYTIKVRSTTAYGKSGWETVRVTPRPAPPVGGGTSCRIEQSPSARAGDASDQTYIDRIKDYYRAQDAVLEGHAATVWEAPGVTPSAPSTAKLSLLNADLVADREALKETGKSRSDSTVELTDVAVQPQADGQVRVTAKVKRTWKISGTATSPAASDPGQVEPEESTISIIVFDRCGNITIVDVPNPAYEDPSDSIDDNGGAGQNYPNPFPPCHSKLPFTTEYNKQFGNRPNINCEGQGLVDKLVKGWYVSTRFSAYWNPKTDVTDERGLPPEKRWDLVNIVNYMRVATTNKSENQKDFNKYLMKHLKPKFTAQVCFVNEKSTTEVTQNASMGISVDGTTTPGASLNANLQYSKKIKYEIGELCKPYTSTKVYAGKYDVVYVATRPTTANECLVTHIDECVISRFAHYFESALRMKFRYKKAMHTPTIHHSGHTFVARKVDRYLSGSLYRVKWRGSGVMNSDKNYLPPWIWGTVSDS
ncbi:LamG-like jellyroll fold domain-containing protein [Nonomuraea ceibae]|uniref:LamG-like jellyroll fold domain-containing protein n=1 Tax=Nonomuraea ceibae TaxID=1935170 RepID=UPI001C5E36AF|nr:LamG-like jellyroll fold domain-containing protein [Nonomuraea ceibae]